MTLKEILNKFRRKNELYEELKEQDRAIEKVQNTKLTGEERALNKIIEKQRQEQIKKQLHSYYQKEDHDYWHQDVITQPNIFKGKGTLLKSKPCFNEKNIFAKGRKY